MNSKPNQREKVVQISRHYSYIIYANLNTLTQFLLIRITDTTTQHQWTTQFSQSNFNTNIYQVTKILLNALKSPNIINRCKIIIYSNYCYLIIDNNKVLPSFALPLVTLNYNVHYTFWSNRALTTDKLHTNTQTQQQYKHQPTRQTSKSAFERSKPVTAVTKPPPVTLDMLITYSKHNILPDNENDYKSLNKTLKGLNVNIPPPNISVPPPNISVPTPDISVPPPPSMTMTNNYIENDMCEQTCIENTLSDTSAAETSDTESSDTESSVSELSCDHSIVTPTNSCTSINGMDKYKNSKLHEIYNDYVKDKNESPANSFDLINFIQFNGIHGINFKDVGKFLMNYK